MLPRVCGIHNSPAKQHGTAHPVTPDDGLHSEALLVLVQHSPRVTIASVIGVWCSLGHNPADVQPPAAEEVAFVSNMAI